MHSSLKPTQELGNNMRFGMAVSFIVYMKELRRKGGETADNRHFYAITHRILESFETNLFFQKHSLIFALDICDFFGRVILVCVNP